MDNNKMLDPSGLSEVWVKNFELVKSLTGDVDTSKGTLQGQINSTNESINEINDAVTAINENIDKMGDQLVMSDDGAFGLRFDGEMLYAKDADGVEHEIQTGGGGGAVMLANPTNINITAKSRAIELTWTDPEDIEVNGIKLAEWAGTRVVRKRDSAPTGKNDGTIVADVKVRNQHSETPLVDGNLTNDVTYYYGVFPYTKTNLYNTDISVSATPRGARILVHADESTLIGETVTCYKGEEIVDTKTIESNRTAVFSFDEIGEYSFVCGNYKAFANVTALGQTVNVTLSTITISITTSELELYEKPISVKLDDVEVATGTMSASGTASISVKDLGNYTIICEDIDAEVEVTEYGQTYEVELSGGILLSSLPVGTKIVDYGSKYYGEPIVWQVLEHGHEGDPENSTSLMSEKILCLKCFDAKEPNNSDSSRRSDGNNRYRYSNILSWLNSEESAGNWYIPKHSVDAPPTKNNVYQGYNAYDQEAGFLTNISTNLRAAMLEVEKTVALNTATDGGTSEKVTAKVHLLARVEVGLGEESASYPEGRIYDYFAANNTDAQRIAKPTAQAVTKSEYADVNLNTNAGWVWWLRSPFLSNSYYARIMFETGRLGNSYPCGDYQGIRPACCIPQNTKLYKDPTADNIYVIKTSEKPTIDTVTNAELKTGNTTATIKWTDPEDLVPVVSWVGTKVVRKAGSAPQNVTDGVVVVNSTVRNEYAEEGFTDEGLTNDTEYFYGIFPYGSDNRYNYETVVSGTPTDLKIVTWADGSWEEIQAMLEAHYNGDIDIADYWAVGDVRSNVPLAAIPSGTTGESQPEQNMELVIIGIEHDDLSDGSGKAAITVQTKDCLNTAGYINSTSNSPTYALWSTCKRRTWCNDKFKAALPSGLSNLIKQVTKLSDRYCTSANSNYSSYRTQEATQDYVFLLSQFEQFGRNDLPTSTYGNLAADGTQYKYMKTQSNRVKSVNGSAYFWYSRSSIVVSSAGNASFIGVNNDGSSSDAACSNVRGVAPAFCL